MQNSFVKNFSYGVLIVFFYIFCCFANSHAEELIVQIETRPDMEPLPLEVGLSALVANGKAPFLYTWNFGDNIASTESTPTHIYTKQGEYEVWVKVTDINGLSGMASRRIVISGVVFQPENISMRTWTDTKEPRRIIQDKFDKNILWVGTSGGLLRFDIVNFESRFYIRELPDVDIKDIIQGSDSSLWIATGNGVVRFNYDTNRWTIIQVSNSELPFNGVNCLLETNNNAVWIGTYSGLARFDYETNEWKVYTLKNSRLPSNVVNSICEAKDGSIWVGTRGGVARFEPAKNFWSIYNTLNSNLPDNEVNSILESSDGAMWIGTWNGGMGRLNPITDQIEVYDYNNSELPRNYVDCFFETKQKNVFWIGTWGGGLIKLDYTNNQWSHFHQSDSGLPDDIIHSLVENSDGSILVGTEKTISKFDPNSNQWSHFNILHSPMPDNAVQNMVQTSDGSIWMGLNTQGLVKFDEIKNQWHHLGVANSPIPDMVIRSMIRASDDSFWVGTKGGLVRYDTKTNQWTLFDKANSNLPDDVINAILEASDGSIWIGMETGGVGKLSSDRKKWEFFNKSETGLADNQIQCILQASDNTLWIGMTYEGLAHYDPSTARWERYNKFNTELKDNHIKYLIQTFDRAIWIGTTYGGLTRFDTQHNVWKTYDVIENGLPDRTILCIRQTQDSALWIGTAGGLSRFDVTNDQWTTFTTTNSSLPDNTVTSILESFDNTIWVGTRNGGVTKITMPSTSQASGSLILIAGHTASLTDTQWFTTQQMASSIYNTFGMNGFKHTDIWYMSPDKWADIDGDSLRDSVVDISGNFTTSDVRSAITEWAVKKYKSGKTLFVYMIGQGIETDSIPGFKLNSSHTLYANELYDMIQTYEQATTGKSVIINESCYSDKFLPHLKKVDRIVIGSGERDNYDHWGVGSLTYGLLKNLNAGKTLYQAFIDAKQESNIKSQLDDNGDGKFDQSDGALSSRIKLTDETTKKTQWPLIENVTFRFVSDQSVSISATTNTRLADVWCNVYPPNYTSNLGNCEHAIRDRIALQYKQDTMSCDATVEGLTEKGIYTIYVIGRDQSKIISVSKPVSVYIGIQGNGIIQGKIGLYAEGYTIMVKDAQLSVDVLGRPTPVASDGTYYLNSIPSGDYTLTIKGPGFEPVLVKDIKVKAGEATYVPDVNIPISLNCVPGDTNNDSKLGLRDAVYILQKISGINE